MHGEPVIVNSVLDLKQKKLFFELDKFVNDCDLYLKLEGFNPGGSIKIKAAVGMVEALEKDQRLIPGRHTLVESSSGSLGVALSIVAKIKGYKFICVSDPNINTMTAKYIKLYGGQLIIVDQRDENGGFLGTRLKYIHKLISKNSDMFWLNQYASRNNVMSHYNETAHEIFTSFKCIDYLFIGVGTSGTIMGCANYIKDHNLPTKIIGIDAVGSVSFGFKAAKRLIPGIGTSQRPQILNEKLLSDVVLVSEADAVRMCHAVLETRALLIGGSTGSVLAGIQKYKARIEKDATLVAISPDFGERYLDTIYDNGWVTTNFPSLVNEQSEC